MAQHQAPSDRMPRRGRRLAQRLGRRRLIVDRELQWSLALRSAVFDAFLLIAVAFGLFAPLMRSLSDENGAAGVHAAEDRAAVMLYLHERFWPIALIAIALSILISLLSSHRIAGPLVRFKRHLRFLGAGMFPKPLRTRSRDFLQEEVRTLNESIGSLERRHGDRCDAFEEVEQAFSRCVDLTEDGAAPQLEAPLRALGEQLEQLRCELTLGSDRSIGVPRAMSSSGSPREAVQ